MKIVLKRKYYSSGMNREMTKLEYDTPSKEVLKTLPLIVNKYYNLGLNKDFYSLFKLLDVDDEYNPYPVPVVNRDDDFIKKKDNLMPLFAEDQDSLDLGSFIIYYDNNGNLFKKKGIFFSKMVPMSDEDFKTFLMNSIVDNECDYSSYGPMGNKIKSLESLIKTKINKL